MRTVETLDKAIKSLAELRVLEAKKTALMFELEKALMLEKILVQHGLERNDLMAIICGGHIGATHNYKGKEMVMRCECCRVMDFAAKDRGDGTCRKCGEPLGEDVIAITPSRLRGHYADHWIGIETNDGRRFWLNEPWKPK